MCGIVGYIGKKEAFDILIKGLKRLEYRGYDSAGIAILDNKEELLSYKKAGKVKDLEDFINDKSKIGNIGIGHTRWATHGEANDKNSHPHISSNGRFALIHNGIIENYSTIKHELIKRNYTFNSDTDTEVIVNLIEEIHKNSGTDIFESIRLALRELVGAYAIVVLDRENPNQLICAKVSSPLVIGIGEDEYYIGSDATPIIEYTKSVIYLNENEIAKLNLNEGIEIKNLDNEDITPYVQNLHLNFEQIEKGGYEHFMLKEIFEQPKSIKDSLRGRINSSTARITLGGLNEIENKILNSNRLIIVSCGTSWHSALIAEYLIEELARINVEVEYASEFRYRNPIINENDVVMAISQSGETADTLAALRLAKQKGATTYGICNVVGSTISRETDAGSYTHAGPEIGVASTKAFTAQITVLIQIALELANKKGIINNELLTRYLLEFENLPNVIEEVLKCSEKCEYIARKYMDCKNALYLGRGILFPIALEGALKLKEISYIHAEGYPAAEMKHGPIALIDENMPIFVIATKGDSYEKIISNIQEVKARKGKIISIITEGDTEVKALSDDFIEIPYTNPVFTPIVATIPLQFLSYYIALLNDRNVDQPRNLAKSVTVE